MTADGAQGAAEPHRYEILPHSMEAEQGLIGALMTDADAIDTARGLIGAEDFFFPAHRRMYEAICRLHEDGQAPTPLRMAPYFANDPDLKDLGGAAYLADAAACAISPEGAAGYAAIVREMALRRALAIAGEDAAAAARRFDAAFSAAAAIEQAEARLAALAEAQQAGQSGPLLLSASVDATLDMINQYQRGARTGIMSGLGVLDDLGGGFQPGQLVIVAGRPSMGKTALALSMAHNMAADDRAVLFFSLEMSRDEMIQRLLARHTGVAAGMQMRPGAMQREHWERVMQARKRLFGLKLAIDDSGGLAVAQIRARARRHQRQHGLDALWIDYLGLMGMDGAYKSLVDQLGEAARALKNLGKELGVPVFLLHQINRGVEGRDDKRPSMADIRDSGKIEEHADVIILLYRDEYYLETNPPKRGPKETDEKFAERQVWHQRRMDEARGKADLIVAKYRNARRETVTVGFNPPRQWFYDLRDADGEAAYG